MTRKLHSALNPVSASIIGINDELMNLYQNIALIYNETYDEIKEKYRTEGSNRIIWPDSVKRAAHKRIRNAINEVLPRITYAFTDEYSSLHPRALAMRNFSFYDIKHTKTVTLEVRFISYIEFLREIQEFVIRVIFEKKRDKLAKIPYEKVENNVVDYINNLFQKSQAEKITFREEASSDMFNDNLIIFDKLSAISCNRYKHVVKAETIPVMLLESSDSVRLPIYHCITCNRYFIGSETLKIYEKLYGKMFVRRIREDNISSDFVLWGESELHRMGYNVRKDDMTTAERQTLLSRLIVDEVMSKFAVCRDLENAIKIFDGRPEYTDAIAKWKDDLLFITNKQFVEEKSAVREF